MLDYAVKLTLRPTEMSESDVAALRDAGWSDEDIMDVAEVTGLLEPAAKCAVPTPEAAATLASEWTTSSS